MTETTEEKPGIDPAQKSELEAMANDFVPESEPIAGEAAASGGPEISGPELWANLILVSSGILSTWRGSHWACSQDEADLLGGAVDPLMEKYLPSIDGKMSPEITFLGALSMYVVPRIMMDQKLALTSEEGGQNGDTTAPQFAE